MINLLIMEYGSGYGGSCSYLYSFLKHLDRETFFPIVGLYNQADGPCLQKIKDMGVELVFLNDVPKDPAAAAPKIRLLRYLNLAAAFFTQYIPVASRMIKLIRSKNIQCIMLNQDVICNIPAILASIITGLPLVARKPGVGPYTARIMRGLLSYFPDAFVASSQAEYNNHIELGFHFKRMDVVYEGIDLEYYHPGDGVGIRKEFGISPDKLLVGYISRIDEGKGHADFIRAAELIVKEFKDAVFLIVGDAQGSYENILKQQLFEQTKTAGLSDNVIFAGWRNDILAIFQALDIFVHCPDNWREGMGIATLEAMACGKPVVLTNNWGLAETAKDKYNGYLVPTGDYKELSKKILALLRSAALRSWMGKNSRERAVEYFDIRNNVRAIENIIRQTVKPQCRQDMPGPAFPSAEMTEKTIKNTEGSFCNESYIGH